LNNLVEKDNLPHARGLEDKFNLFLSTCMQHV